MRTSAEAVSKVIDVDDTLDLSAFIKPASLMVDWLDSKDTDNTLSDTVLEEIECWLAAHFYHCKDHQLSSKSHGGASGTFQGQLGLGLNGTYWGQMALRLDTTGLLAQNDMQAGQGQSKKARLIWAGTKYSDQQRYNNGSW